MTYLELKVYNKKTLGSKDINIILLDTIKDICTYKYCNDNSYFVEHTTCTVKDILEKIKSNEVFVTNLNIFQYYF